MQVVPLVPRRLHEDRPHERLDLLIGGLGWELRSRRIPEAFRESSERIILLDLDSAGQAHYDANLEFAEQAGFRHPKLKPRELTGWLVERIGELGSGATTPHRVGIDISSLSRDRIAYLIEGIRELEATPAEDAPPATLIDFLYTPALPPERAPGPEHIEILGPVTAHFAGFVPEPNSPVIAFVGLGIEEDRAIGAMEYIEPARTTVFVPYGENEKFDEELRAANSLVWQQVPDESRIHYRVDDPLRLYTTLEEQVFNASSNGRPILVPLGPKIFAACCLLVASQHSRAGVWRVSTGDRGSSDTVESAGKLIRLRLEVGRTGAFGPSARASAGSRAQ